MSFVDLHGTHTTLYVRCSTQCVTDSVASVGCLVCASPLDRGEGGGGGLSEQYQIHLILKFVISAQTDEHEAQTLLHQLGGCKCLGWWRESEDRSDQNRCLFHQSQRTAHIKTRFVPASEGVEVKVWL